jgi:hypothetical protein
MRSPFCLQMKFGVLDEIRSGFPFNGWAASNLNGLTRRKARADFLLLCPTRFCEERLFLAEKPRERPWVLGTPIGNPL